jgi:hypothetical protein
MCQGVSLSHSAGSVPPQTLEKPIRSRLTHRSTHKEDLSVEEMKQGDSELTAASEEAE